MQFLGAQWGIWQALLKSVKHLLVLHTDSIWTTTWSRSYCRQITSGYWCCLHWLGWAKKKKRKQVQHVKEKGTVFFNVFLFRMALGAVCVCYLEQDCSGSKVLKFSKSLCRDPASLSSPSGHKCLIFLATQWAMLWAYNYNVQRSLSPTGSPILSNSEYSDTVCGLCYILWGNLGLRGVMNISSLALG